MHGKSVAFESALERDFLVLLDFDVQVARVIGQPMQHSFLDADGRSRRYTPDFRVDHVDGTSSVHEVKYRDDLWANWKNLRPGIKAARKHARQQGWSFSVVTEVEIRGSALLANSKFLRPYRDFAEQSALEEQLQRTLAVLGESTPETLLVASFQSIDNRMRAVASIWRLMARDRVHADLGRRLTMNTPLWLNRG